MLIISSNYHYWCSVTSNTWHFLWRNVRYYPYSIYKDLFSFLVFISSWVLNSSFFSNSGLCLFTYSINYLLPYRWCFLLWIWNISWSLHYMWQPLSLSPLVSNVIVVWHLWESDSTTHFWPPTHMLFCSSLHRQALKSVRPFPRFFFNAVQVI